MITQVADSTIRRLHAARVELDQLNRTVTHRLCLATEPKLLAPTAKAQHVRRVPCTWGRRRDTFYWDSWDRKVRGEDDHRKFFEIAERIGGCLPGLEETEAGQLLPGTAYEVVGRRTQLYLPDYWLLVVHHLGWTDQLPYECKLQWRQGESMQDEPFSLASLLPVNIVQASIDALTVLIDAASPGESDGTLLDWTAANAKNADSAGMTAVLAPDAMQVGIAAESFAPRSQPIATERRVKKRADRSGNIEALKLEMIEVIRAQREHARSATDFGREPELLPRPSRRELAERIGITEAAVSRCFSDRAAPELNLLWETAGDLDAVLRFGR